MEGFGFVIVSLMKLWNPFKRKRAEDASIVEKNEGAPQKQAVSRSRKVLRATKDILRNLFKIPKLPPGWDKISTGVLLAISGTLYLLSEGDMEDSTGSPDVVLGDNIPDEKEIFQEEFAPLPEISIDAVPGDGVITMLMKWAEAAAADSSISTQALGEKLGALVEAVRSNGDVYPLAEALAKDSGLYQPNETIDSFNVYKDGALRFGSDGSGGYTLTFTNPGGDSHTLFSLSPGGLATSHPPYQGDQMIDTKK